MNIFPRENNGFYNTSFYYGVTDSKYIEKKDWDVLDKANLKGKQLCQGKKITNRQYFLRFIVSS